MSDAPVLYSAADGVATLTLNRPQVLNSFTPELLSELVHRLRRAADERQRAVLITGAGRGFCAGQDLDSIQDQYTDGGTPDLRALLRDHFHPMLRYLKRIPMPVIAAVNGVAAGAGMSLALACDLRVAADNARFATAFTRIGLVPDAGMAQTLPRLIGAGRAMSILVSGEQVDAATALNWGMVDRVFPAASFGDEAAVFARQVAAGPTHAFVMTRELLNRAEELSWDGLLAAEADVQQLCAGTEDHRGAVGAFLRKEAATFSGR
jgi:2-(1,2-epoxy-1,2-dihydrophenyl)acetyl-CoA isomerase